MLKGFLAFVVLFLAVGGLIERAHANNCVLRTWVTPALPTAQPGLPIGNCSEIAATSRASCEAWCDQKITAIQGQISSTGPVQYPLFCVWDGTYINGCTHPSAGVTISMSDKAYLAPEKCSSEIKIDDVQSAAAERLTFSELNLPPDQLASRVMERAAVAWARNCTDSINAGYSPGLLFWHYFTKLVATKAANGAISVAVTGSQTADATLEPRNFTLKANQEIYAATNGSGTDPAYLACNAVRTAPNGPTEAQNDACRAMPEIDEVFDLASAQRRELSQSTTPATHLATVASQIFPAYQRKLLYDLATGAQVGVAQRLNFGFFKNWATNDQASTRCIFPRLAQSYQITGCSYVGGG